MTRRFVPDIWAGFSRVAPWFYRTFGSHRDAQYLSNSAYHSMVQGNHKRAILEAECAIAADPKWVGGYRILSTAHRHAGNPLQAKEAAERGLTADPLDATLYTYLGDAEAELGHLADAERAYRRGLEVLPEPNDARSKVDMADVLMRLAIVVRALRRPTEAIELLQRSLALRPGNAEALTSLGEAYINLKDYTSAVTVLTEAVKRDRPIARAHYRLAESLVMLGRPQEALAHARRAVELEPGDDGVRSLLEMIEKMLAASGPTEGREPADG